MKTKNTIKKLGMSALLLLCGAITSHAQDTHTGGGDDNEIRVNEIRGDILSWIKAGGADELSFAHSKTNLTSYKENMISLLQPHAVVISFTDKKIIVSGEEKTCKGFIHNKVYHIKCNLDRFPSDETKQYRLIHHEFAGLANAEKNIGASSDYFLSDQITKSLTQTVTLKLAVKKSNTASLCINKRIEVIPTALLYLQSFYPEEGYDLYKSYRCLNGYNDQNGNFVIKNITDQINNKNAAAIKAANDTRLYPNTGNGVNLSEFGGDVTLYATVLYADELSEMCQGFGYKKGFIKYTLNKVFKQLDTIEDFNFIKDKFKNKSEIWYEHETRKGNKYYDSESVLVQVTEAKCLR